MEGGERPGDALLNYFVKQVQVSLVARAMDHTGSDDEDSFSFGQRLAQEKLLRFAFRSAIRGQGLWIYVFVEYPFHRIGYRLDRRKVEEIPDVGFQKLLKEVGGQVCVDPEVLLIGGSIRGVVGLSGQMDQRRGLRIDMVVPVFVAQGELEDVVPFVPEVLLQILPDKARGSCDGNGHCLLLFCLFVKLLSR